jgi:prepilin-type N-terminal cleavage/methylation domain-containing protein
MTRSRRGMTLMELVIALAITGMMATAGAAAFGSIIDQRRAMLAATTDTERAAALRATLHAWLTASTILVQQGGLPNGGRGGGAGTSLRTVSPAGTSTVQSVIAATASGDELNFTTTADNPAQSSQATMRLFIDGDDKTAETGLTLEYKASTQSPLQRRELDAGIAGMTVEYLDQRTGRWYDASQASTITPRALRLTLQPAAGYPAPGLLSLPMVLPMGPQAQPGRGN